MKQPQKPPVSFRNGQLLTPLSELPPLSPTNQKPSVYQQKKIMAPPTIVIPQLNQWKKMSRINTPQTAVKVLEQDLFSMNFRKKIHPLTPHVHLSSELSPLIKRCTQFNDYPYVSQSGDLLEFFNANPEDPIIKKKTETLNSILKIVSDPISRHSIPPNTIEELFEMIENHIFRSIPKFPPPNDFSEVAQFWIVKNWTHIQIIHKIIQGLMNDQSIFSALLNDDFLYDLIMQLCSPDSNERKEIENELKIIIKLFHNKRGFILRSILSKTISYIDGCHYLADSVGSYLQIFIEYFTSQTEIKQRYFHMFRTVFYPLFSTDLSTHFELPLHKLSAIFQSRDQETACWCLFYLKNHWPVTSTKKQLLFVTQFTNLLQAFPFNSDENVRNAIVHIIVHCVNSQSYVISSKMMLICSDLNFLATFPSDSLKKIVFALKNASNHWKKGQKELAEGLLSDISALMKDDENKENDNKNEVGKKIKWEMVINAASANNDNIEVKNEVKKLNIFSTEK